MAKCLSFPFGFTFRPSLVGLGQVQAAARRWSGTNWPVVTNSQAVDRSSAPPRERQAPKGRSRRVRTSRQVSFAGPNQTKKIFAAADTKLCHVNRHRFSSRSISPDHTPLSHVSYDHTRDGRLAMAFRRDSWLLFPSLIHSKSTSTKNAWTSYSWSRAVFVDLHLTNCGFRRILLAA